MNSILVAPTIREQSINEFLSAWQGVFDAIIVVEDNPERTFNLKADYHYCWKDIDADLGDDAWIISRRDSGIKCYGFLKAVQMGAEYVFCLDDDCLPNGDDFKEKHINNLTATSRWTPSVIGTRTRGIPYQNIGSLDSVVFSHGLWKEVGDYDAIQSLNNPPEYFNPPSITRIIPKNQYFPFCGMNFAFKRCVGALCYFPLMGVNSPYHRFDDIWFGIIAKKICDHLDYSIVCGEPFIVHKRASNVFDNLVKEAPGIRLNETFWKVVDSVVLKENTPTACMQEMGVFLSQNTDSYIAKLGQAIQRWANLFHSMSATD